MGTDITDQLNAKIGSDTKDEPPKQSNTSKQKQSKSTPPKQTGSNPGKLANSLSNLYGQLGMMLYPFDMHCGGALLENADSMAKTLEDLSKENPQVKKVLERITETSAFGQVAMAHAPVVMAIVSHHGPQVASMFRKPEKDKPETEDSETGLNPDSPVNNVPPAYHHPGDNAV